MGTVYTVGYKGLPPQELKEKVESVNGVLVDTRFRPYSPAPMWKQHALRELMGGLMNEGGRYLHLKGFGNENYQTPGMENVRLHDPELAFRIIRGMLEVGVPPVLLCACTDPFQCHRVIAAQYILHHMPPGAVTTEHWTWKDFPGAKEPKPEAPKRAGRGGGGLVIPAHASSMDPEAEGLMRKRGRRARGIRKLDRDALDLFTTTEGGDEDVPF